MTVRALEEFGDITEKLSRKGDGKDNHLPSKRTGKMDPWQDEEKDHEETWLWEQENNKAETGLQQENGVEQ